MDLSKCPKKVFAVVQMFHILQNTKKYFMSENKINQRIYHLKAYIQLII